MEWRRRLLGACALGYAALAGFQAHGAVSDATVPGEAADNDLDAPATDQPETADTARADDPHHGLAHRKSAVTVAINTVAACRDLGDFYWEIGDGGGPLASGARGTRYSANRPLQVASSSKLVFAAYVVERTGGQLSPDQLDALEMRSGYDSFNPLACFGAHTVAACLDRQGNGTLHAGHKGQFSYNGGHDQHLAVTLGLGTLDRYGLAAEVRRVLGPELHLDYAAPRVAGGLKASPAAYGAFLRKVVAGHLRLRDLLGSHAICTQGADCPSVQHPDLPRPWHYSLNHWIEDGPGDDGAFSAPGMMGFYPWISADRRTYGLIAREVMAPKAYLASMACGQALRRAWNQAPAS
ncbi:MAG: hypothetical protein PW843_01715 [Azospirillaceae bacterium]|nr:hypothetical protein [Azospirillaceae bacterium]